MNIFTNYIINYLKDFGTLRLEAYLIDIIDEYDIPQGVFDYEKFLLE